MASSSSVVYCFGQVCFGLLLWDDSFDYDQGWRGKGQFWFTIQDGDSGDGGEHDGDIDDNTRLPIAKPTIYNATFIGGGMDSVMANEPSTSVTMQALNTTTASSPTSTDVPWMWPMTVWPELKRVMWTSATTCSGWCW